MNVMAIAEGSPAVFRNKTDLKKFVRSHDGASSDDLVKAINLKVTLSIFAANEAYHHRLDAGRMLLELRTRIEAEGGDWWKWQTGKFDRSRRDMEKLMQMARADDPEAAVEEERAKARERMQRTRSSAANVRRIRPPDNAAVRRSMVSAIAKPVPNVTEAVGAFHHELTNTLNDYCGRLEAFLDANPHLDDECLGGLIQVLEVNSMRLQQLAQQIDGR